MLPGSPQDQAERRNGIVLGIISFALFMLPTMTEEFNPDILLPYMLFPLAAGIFTWFWATRRSRLRHKIFATAVPKNWEPLLSQKVAFYLSLDTNEKVRFKKMIQIFLKEKRITGIGTQIDEELKLLVAASAIIPVFGFPNWEYFNLGEILVLPGTIESHLDNSDRKYFTLGQVRTIRNKNIMLLSRPALEQGFQTQTDKKNVGIHEFAHVIDQADGSMDGIPGLQMPRKYHQRWKELVAVEMNNIRRGRSLFRRYGGTNPVEFFAVVTETFFEKPDLVKKQNPELYSILRNTFRQHTHETLNNDLEAIFHPWGRRIGRNTPCPCGSGEKYKKCCLDK